MSEKNIIKKLAIVPVRTAFPNEARDLTPWLAENVDALGERLGIELSLEQKEKSVGDFQVDLLCQDGQGRKVIIENQLEQTDHDHLGKLMTYLVNLSAKVAIWITGSPRPEHQKVVEWLNETMPGDMSFYLVKVEAIKTADSTYSPLFNVLTGPDRQVKKVGQEKREWAQRHFDRLDFWRGLLGNERIKSTQFAGREPQPRYYMSAPAGVPDSRFGFTVGQYESTVYLAFRFKEPEKTRAVFRRLAAQKPEIEREFKEALTWQEEKGANWPWIGKSFPERGLKDRAAWPQLQNEMVDAMIRLDKVLRGRLRQAYEASA